MEEATITARRVAGLTGRTMEAVKRRAIFERWPYVEIPPPGSNGLETIYRVWGLPGDIKNMIRMEDEMKKTLEERFEPVADPVVRKAVGILGSEAFDRVCIAVGIFALGWLVAWMHFIGQRG